MPITPRPQGQRRNAKAPELQVPGLGGGGCEIRTREAVTPTRFPSVRHRPLGESSTCAHTTYATQLE